MKIELFLLCFSAAYLVISANQHITIPVQTYPIYQQDICNNVQGSTPIILRSSNNNPNIQKNTGQYQTPDDIAKVLVNRVLSNPTIHRILDPNTKFYNQNGVELQNSIYNGGATQAYNGGVIPNVINNYFIVPPEYLKLNGSGEIPVPKQSKNVIKNEKIKKTAGKTANNKQDKPLQSRGVNNEILSEKNYQKNIKSRSKSREHSKIRITENEIREKKYNDTDVQDTSKSRSKENFGSQNRKKETPALQATVGNFKDNKSLQGKENSVTDNNTDQNKSSQKRTRKKRPTTNTTKDGHYMNAKTDNTQHKKEKAHIDAPLATEIENVISKTPIANTLTINEVENHDNSKSKILENNQSQIEEIEQQILNSEFRNIDNRVPRNSKDEVIIRDFRQKFPEVPESLARTMLSYIQDQFQNQFGNNLLYPNSYPFSLDRYFQMPQYSNIGRNNVNDNKSRNRSRKRKQKNRRKKRKRNRHKSKNSSLKKSEITSETPHKVIKISSGIEPDLFITTEEPETIQDKSDTTPTELYINSFELSTEPIDSTTKLNYIQENSNTIEDVENKSELGDVDEYYNIEDTTIFPLGQEDTVPIMYDNRLIEDYYPIFTDTLENTANNKENYVKKLNDRYFYTTDRNAEFHSNAEKIKPVSVFKAEQKIPDRIFKESLPRILKYRLRDPINQKHTYFDVDGESFKNPPHQIPRPLVQQKETIENMNKHVETEFKTPPGLEFPDFLTKKIDKNTLKSNHRFYDSFDAIDSYMDDMDKSSIYSEFKTPTFSGRGKPNGEIRRIKVPSRNAKPSNVETVHANSRIAKYGAGSEDSVENTAPINFDYSQYYNDNNDHTSYVTAKSLGYPKEFW